MPLKNKNKQQIKQKHSKTDPPQQTNQPTDISFGHYKLLKPVRRILKHVEVIFFVDEGKPLFIIRLQGRSG